ncbi:hyaluronidase-like [Microplitis mediator]|uniref:hyaluronidase-like n=1 Tax=Microplitis mediator TaxID=375433 RepID=UPI0025542CED|nr:hyaluronidase-like [Microplitis mediator]
MGFFNLSNITIFLLLIILKLNLSSGASGKIKKGSPSRLEDNRNKVNFAGVSHVSASMQATSLDGDGNDNLCFNHGTARSYQVYWNVPTFMCQQYGININDLNKFGICQNENDKFLGEKIVILYDPGRFPKLIQNDNGTMTRRNGGVPQEGNLQSHLDAFTTQVEEEVEENFSGLAVIDFESWRPIFRQNWAALLPYRYLSVRLERQRNPSGKTRSINRRVIQSFESAAKLFMEETIKLAKRLRPRAHWTYYGYPYCYNYTPGAPWASCEPQTLRENDRLSWLWELEDVISPSMYLRYPLSTDQRIGLVAGRLHEAVRIKTAFPNRPIIPVFWFKFIDKPDIYLTREDVRSSFDTMIKNGADSHMIWASYLDVNSRDKCLEVKKYINDILGPAVEEVKQAYHLMGHV